MSTTRPLASEMTGTSRETSGKTVPVAFNSAGYLHLSGLDNGKLRHVVLVDGDQIHVGHLDHLGRRRSAIALILLLWHPAKSQGNGPNGNRDDC